MKEIAENIIVVLAPVIGEGLAKSAVTVQCRKLGILPENLSRENIDEFTIHFKKMMEIFAGEKMADDIIKKIRLM